MYVYVKLLSGDLNPDSYPLHPTSTYICEVNIMPRVRGDIIIIILIMSLICGKLNHDLKA